MTIRQHSHPKYIQLFKNSFAILTFVYPAYRLLTSITNYASIRIVEIFLALFTMIVMLVTAYFFQDIWADEEGLQIEFLWRKYRLLWEDIIEVKYAGGLWLAPEEKRPLVVLVNGLTPFHHVFGFIYASSAKPGFVVFPSISDFQALKDNIRKHINARSTASQ